MAFAGPTARRFITMILSKPQAVALLTAELQCVRRFLQVLPTAKQKLGKVKMEARAIDALDAAEKYDWASA